MTDRWTGRQMGQQTDREKVVDGWMDRQTDR